MAETIRIEIPVTVQDQTGSGLSSIASKLQGVARASQQTSRTLKTLGRSTGLESSLGKLNKTMGSSSHVIEITAHDKATPVISSVEDAAARAGTEITMGIGAEDKATEVINNADDALAAADGNSGVMELAAEDNATEVINNADDALAAADGNSGVMEVAAEDNATEVIHNAMDAGAELDGSHYTATLDIVSNLGNGLSGVAQNGTATARNMIAGVVGAAGLSLGIGSAVSSFSDFEAGMSQVQAISGATSEEMADLTQKAKEMGATTKFTATQSAEAFNYMAMAGWKPDEMMDGIEGIMNLAAASGESLGTTSDIVTDALTAFGLKAGDSNHFSDVMAQTAANANTNVSMLGESFKYVGSLAGAMGYSIEDVGLALGLMANAGVKGSMAGTALRTSISNLAAPTDQMLTAMEKYGISLVDEKGNMKSLKGVMDEVRTSLSGLSEDEQAAAVKTIFGKNAMAGMLAVINASEEDYNSLAEAIGNADGAASDMSSTMLDNLQGSMTLLSSAVEGVQNNLGGRLANYIRPVVDDLTAAMPAVSQAVTDFFDDVDVKLQQMFDSQAWEDADLLGKVNIAWDTLIADPFTEWATGDGLTMVSETIQTLFSEAFKILPGGEDAGLTSWLSAGVLALVGTKVAGLASHIGEFSTAVSGLGESGTLFHSFASGLGTAIPWLVGGAAALAALNFAIDTYNQKQITNSISEHFGEIKLTEAQIQALSDVILDVDWTASITVGLEEIKEAETLRSDAKAKLEENDSLEYEAKVGVKLTADDQEAYQANCEAFVKSVQDQITESAKGLTMIVDSMKIETPEGGSLADLIDDFAAEDISELSTLEAAYSAAVQDALSKGLQDVDANQLVAEMEAKIQEVQDRWSNARQKAAEQMIRDTYMGKSGAELEGGTYQSLITQMQEDRAALSEELAQAREAFYTHLYANEDRYTANGYDINDLIESWRKAEEYTKQLALANALQYETTSLNDAYAEEIGSWSNNGYQDSTAREGYMSSLNSFITHDAEGNATVNHADTDMVNDMLRSNIDRYYNTSADAGLQALYQQMEPDVQAMQGIIDSYAEAGAEVPKALMDQYNAAIELGAAAGSESAGMQMFAKSLVDSGQQDLINAIQSGQIGDDSLRQALTRALLTPSEDMEMDINGFKAKVGEIELEESSAEQAGSDLLEKTQTFIDSVTDNGGSYEITESGVQVSFEDVQVASESLGQSVEEFCANYGVDAGELEANGTVTISAQEIDMSMARAAAEADTQEAFSEEIPAEGSADVEMTQTNNADDIYREVDEEVKSTFSSPFSTSATVNVTLNWNITNPTASISVGTSGGTATATISSAGFANGGFVDGAMLSWVGEDGPEAIIPLGEKRRARGLELWAQAGAALGVGGFADGGIVGDVPASGGWSGAPVSTNGGSEGKSVSVTLGGVTFNINGGDGDVMKQISDNLEELSDQIAAVLAEKLGEQYENTPIAS